MRINRVKRRRKVSKAATLGRVFSKYSRGLVYKNAVRASVLTAKAHLYSRPEEVKGRPGYLRHQAGPQILSHTFHDRSPSRLISSRVRQNAKTASPRANKRWLALQEVSKTGLLVKRVPKLDKNNRPIRQRGQPVTAWDISNRDVNSIMGLLKSDYFNWGRGLKYHRSLSLSLDRNFRERKFRSYTRGPRWGQRVLKHGLGRLETWTKAAKTGRHGLGFHNSSTSLRGSQTKVVRVSPYTKSVTSTLFRSNTARLSKILSLPPTGTKGLWVSPTYISTRRCIYRTIRGMKRQDSTTYNIVSNGAVGLNKSTSEKKFLPPWWFEARLQNLANKLAMGAESARQIKLFIGETPVSNVAAVPFLKDTLIKTKDPAVRKRLQSLLLIIEESAFTSKQHNARYFVTRNKFREFTNYLSSSSARSLRRSVVAGTRQSTKDVDLGCYQRHPRFTSKTIRILPTFSHKLRSILRFNRPKISLKNRLWLRNAGLIR